MSGGSKDGRFMWYELMTTDPGGAEEFYTAVTGWGTAPFDGAGDMPYTMWMQGEAPVGGLMQLPPEAAAHGAPPHWLAYIGTPDLDATYARALELGASTYVPPTTIPDVGRFAVLADPQGATFAAYTPAADSPGHPGPAKVGEFSWHELITTDHPAALGFYADLFGWEKTDEMDMGDMGVYQMYGQGDETYGGMYNKPEEIPGPPHWLLYVRVPDVTAAAETVTRLGGQVLNGPMDVPGGDRVVQCMDPQGGVFALHWSGADGS